MTSESKRAKGAMDPQAWLAERFEEHRTHLETVAYRLLGSSIEAEDAVQEAWLRLSRADRSEVANLGGWLTTVVARICFDMLRTRKVRSERSLSDVERELDGRPTEGIDPEQEALLADSVGLALLMVLDTLTPAERMAFVLHDLFAVPFDEIAPIVGRTPVAARQLASRARRRVQGAAPAADVELSRQRAVVDAFLAATRGGDFSALLAVLDPDVVQRADPAAVALGAPAALRGAEAVAQRALQLGARGARTALVNGAVGVVVARQRQLVVVLDLTIRQEQIVAIDVIADPVRLRQFDLVPFVD
jgi:RNA polymerase sigma-70 factor (ECF subfamily)